MSIEKIIGVSIVSTDGKRYDLRAPNRHHHIFWHYCKDVDDNVPLQCGTQGFYTDLGRFVNRIEGLAIATAANQLKPTEPIRQGKLFSENVW